MPKTKKPAVAPPKIYRDQSSTVQVTEAQARALGIPIKGKSKPAVPQKVTGNNVGGSLKFRRP